MNWYSFIMNWNKISWIAVIAALMLTGCNNDLVIQGDANENSIEFSAVMDKTRTSLVTEDELTSFYLHAGESGSDDLSFMNVAAYLDGGVWTYAPKKYWPGYDLDFYAYAPIMDVNMTKKPYAFTGGGVGFEYEVPFDQSVSNTAVDLLVAYAENQSYYDGSVELNFEHALSSVIFSAENQSKNMIFNIHSIEITKLYNKGTYTYSSGWEPITTEGKIEYKAGIPESGVTIYPNVGFTFLLSLNDYLMVLPQDIEPDVDVYVTYSYIDLLEKNEIKRFEAQESNVEKSFPLNEFLTNNGFEKGKRYNFKFELDVDEATIASLSVAIDNSVGNDGSDRENSEEGMNVPSPVTIKN